MNRNKMFLMLTKGYKILNVVCLCIAAFSNGNSLSAVGPTLVTWKNRLCTDYEHLSSALVARAVGAVISGLVFGAINNRCRDQLNLSIGLSVLVNGIAMTAVAWCNHLEVFAALELIMGACEGWIQAASNLMLLLHWNEDVVLPLSLKDSFLTLGDLAVTLLARPFLRADLEQLKVLITDTGFYKNTTIAEIFASGIEFNCNPRWNETRHHFDVDSVNTIIKRGTVVTFLFSATYTPYITVGGVSLLFGAIISLFTILPVPLDIKNKINTRKPDYNETAPIDVGKTRKKYRLIFCVLYLSVTTIAGARCFTMLAYTVTLAIESDLHFLPHIADDLMMASLATRFLGRASFGLLSHQISIKVLCPLNALLGVLLTGVLLVFGMTSSLVFWLFVCMSGFVMAPAGSLVFAFADRFVMVTGYLVILNEVAAQAGGLAQYLINGAIFDQVDAWWILIWIFVLSLSLLVFVVCGLFVSRKLGDRFEYQQKFSFD